MVQKAVWVRVPPSAFVFHYMQTKKNILLINPWIYDFTAYDFWLKPLGLLTIAALIKQYTPHKIDFIDCLDRHHPGLPKKLKTKIDGRGPFYKEEVEKPSILKKIPRKYSRYGIPLTLFHHEMDRIPKPDIVLLTCTMTYWYPGVRLVTELIRKRFGNVPIVLGGFYATLLPHHAKAETGVDLICTGLGEKNLFSLLRQILGDGGSPQIEFSTLEETPYPMYSLLRNKKSLPMITSRGCPYKCTFCISPILYEHFEQISPDRIVGQIDRMFLEFKPNNLAFYDDALLINKKQHIIPILEKLILKKYPIHFHTPNGLHIKEIDLELARLFKQANFQSLYLSQESFDQEFLLKTGNKVKSDDIVRALAALEKAGFKRKDINVYLLAGLPGQKFMSIKDSILSVQSLGARPHLAFYSPIPSTPEWKKAVEQGYFTDNIDPLLHNKLTFPYLWGSLSPEEFSALKQLLKKENNQS